MRSISTAVEAARPADRVAVASAAARRSPIRSAEAICAPNSLKVGGISSGTPICATTSFSCDEIIATSSMLPSDLYRSSSSSCARAQSGSRPETSSTTMGMPNR